MPRRAKITARPLLPDAKYNSELVTRFINKIMQRGKKGTCVGMARIREQVLDWGFLDLLARIHDDPAGAWRAKDPAIVHALASLELRETGLRPPPLPA